MTNIEMGRKREAEFAKTLEARGLTYVYQPAPFFLCHKYKNENPFKNYRPDFWVPSENKYYEVIGSRQRIRDNSGRYLKKIEAVERRFGVQIEIVRPDGVPYPRVPHQGLTPKEVEKRQTMLENWNAGLTLSELAKMFSVSYQTLSNFAKKRNLKYRRPSGVDRWNKEGEPISLTESGKILICAIPSLARKKLELKRGDKLYFYFVDNGLVLLRSPKRL